MLLRRATALRVVDAEALALVCDWGPARHVRMGVASSPLGRHAAPSTPKRHAFAAMAWRRIGRSAPPLHGPKRRQERPSPCDDRCCLPIAADAEFARRDAKQKHDEDETAAAAAAAAGDGAASGATTTVATAAAAKPPTAEESLYATLSGMHNPQARACRVNGMQWERNAMETAAGTPRRQCHVLSTQRNVNVT